MEKQRQFLLAFVSAVIAAAVMAAIVFVIVTDKNSDAPSDSGLGVGGGGPSSPEIRELAELIPIPGEAKIVQELVSTGSDALLVYSIEKPPLEMLAFYEAELGTNWQKVEDASSGYLKADGFHPASSTTLVFDADRHKLVVSIIENRKTPDSDTLIGVTIEPQ